MTELEKYKGLFLDATKQGGLYRDEVIELRTRFAAIEKAAREVKEHCETGMVTRAWVVKRLAEALTKSS